MQIQNLYIIEKDYEESRKYAKKCLKLAVITNNKYLEFKSI